MLEYLLEKQNECTLINIIIVSVYHRIQHSTKHTFSNSILFKTSDECNTTEAIVSSWNPIKQSSGLSLLNALGEIIIRY